VASSGTTATFTPSAPLAAATKYTATVTTGAKDLGGASLAVPYAWSFTTAAAPTGGDNTVVDSDGDGVPDVDDDFPHDNRNATPGTPRGKGKIRIDVSPILGAYLTETHAFGEDLDGLVQSGRPAGYHFNDGLVSFKINGGATAGNATMEITYPATVPAGSRVYKVTASGYQEITDAVISGNRVTVPVGTSSASQGLVMGGAGVASASVVGVASPDAAAASSSGGGCSATGGSDGSWGTLVLVGAALSLKGLLARRRG
jgi:hypothetical protein